jgi:hypothetical protein
MKEIYLLLIILWISQTRAIPSELTEYLRKQENVEQIEILPVNASFVEKVQILVRQPLDHHHPQSGSFLQRVFVSFREIPAPVVLVTEGYAAEYGKNPEYIHELGRMIRSNQVVVEHRYFGHSRPDSLNWQFLTVENAASDHHAVVAILKPFFSGKWIGTGISKGGQTALLHRMFYPDDVDLTVSYVAPLNFAVEDGRHEPYIAKVPGTKTDRSRVKKFQKEVLRRRDRMMPLFEEFIREKKLTFKSDYPEIYDFTLLEFSFSFWQWGHKPEEIPDLSATDEEIFRYWMKISSPDYFSCEGFGRTGPFFVQAARELGYYGYHTRPFRKLLSIRTAKGYLARLFLPSEFHPAFDPTSAFSAQRFLNTTNLPMIFIYGKNDPWSASGVVIPGKSAVIKVIQDGGSHRTRISNLDEQNKKKVLEKISETVGLFIPEVAF